MKALVLLLVLNLIAILGVAWIVTKGSGGEVGMLPFIAMPIIGAISLILLVVVSLIFKRHIFGRGAGIAVFLIIAGLNILELSLVL